MPDRSPPPADLHCPPPTEGARRQSCPTAPRRQAASAAEASTAKFIAPKRLAQIAILLLTSVTMLGAGTPSTRFDRLGHKLMCPCGCAEILLECNHVGCPDSDRMIGELKTQLATVAVDGGVLHWFANKYGATVLAAPISGGFDVVAWIMPFAVLALALLAAVWLLRHWRDRHTQTTAALPTPPSLADDLRNRIRHETTYDP